jgi:hypothetical protein
MGDEEAFINAVNDLIDAARNVEELVRSPNASLDDYINKKEALQNARALVLDLYKQVL